MYMHCKKYIYTLHFLCSILFDMQYVCTYIAYISQICHNIAHFILYIIYMFILELHPNLTALVGAALHFTAEEKMCSLVQLDLLMRFSQWKRKTGKLEYWEIGT